MKAGRVIAAVPTFESFPQSVRKPFTGLWAEAVRLHFRWRLYKQLYGDATRVALLNEISIGLFYQLQFVMLDDVVLASARLLDRDTRAMSLYLLIERVGKTESHKIVPVLKSDLNKLRKLGGPLVAHRNKRIAHASIEHHPAMVGSVLPGITVGRIDRFLRGVADLINAIADEIGGSRVGEPVSQAGDGDTLIWNLCKAADYDDLFPDGYERAQRLAKSRYGEAWIGGRNLNRD